MKKIVWLPVLIGVAFLTTVIQSCKNADSPAGHALKLNLEENKRYEYNIAWDTDQEMMGRGSRVNVHAGYVVEVTEMKDNIKTLKVTYNSFRLYMKIMDMEMDIDTEKPVDDATGEDETTMMKKIFREIKGKSFMMKVDEDGTILSINGIQAIINNIVSSAAVDEDMKLQMSVSLQDQFNEQELKDQFAEVFMIFPNKPVKPGDSWRRDYRRGSKISANFATTYTVKAINESDVTLDANTSISSANEETDIKGKQTGTLTVDSKTGLVTSAEFLQYMDATTRDFGIKVNSKGKIEGSEK